MSDRRPRAVRPAPGQESVWDYPRPPRLERTAKHLQVVFAGVTIADTTRAWRVLETSHPPVYYVPPDDVRFELLLRSARTSVCEWKGRAAYWSVVVGARTARDAAFGYPEPSPAFRAIRGHVAFYAGAMDACTVDGELATPQPGQFYAGWITRDIVGPLKGDSGTASW